MEEIVVTGSLIKGTPEDTALPVDVYNSAELEKIGAPSSLDFVKSLTVQGSTTGEGYYFSGAMLNNDVGFNLRGLGPDKTLTLFNGRRLGGNTTSAVAGRQANTNILPAIAFQRIELLKDGAAVTYGADATGGVVNYITRDSYTGMNASVSYRGFAGSSGDYTASFLTGFGEEDTNIMLAVEWDHRSELDTKEREFSSLPYGTNPAPWSTLTNLAGWTPRATLPATPVISANGDGEWGTRLGLASDFTQSSCEAVGGIYQNAFSCAYGYIPYYNLVEKANIYRVFAQVNSTVSDTMEFHGQVLWAKQVVPHAIGSPAQPVIRGPAMVTGLTYQFYVPITNPYAAEFATRSGWNLSPFFGFTQGYTPITYRAFAHSGNQAFATDGNFGVPTTIDNRYLHISGGISGTAWNDIAYDVAMTFNQQSEAGTFPDVIGYRLQEAMNGFGGPDCNVPDLDSGRFGTQNAPLAGTGSCQWWNPFASSWAGQPILGLSNPAYVAGTENPADLVDWVFNPRGYENNAWNATLDAVVSGETSIELPGGNVAWGVGTQFRTTRLRDTVPDPLYNGSQPCAWPGQDPADPTDPNYTGCTPDEPGPFVFFDTNEATAQYQDQFSYFAELNLPILDTLEVSAAARHEEFTGDLKADVYKFAGKWQIVDRFAVRGSYGTNYQAPGLGIVPGEVNNGVNSYTVAAGNWRGAQTVTRSGINPETATVWNVGGIWQSEGFTGDSSVQITLDYWNIETEDELGLLASANQIADAVFSITNPGGGFNLADCSNAFAGRVTFNGGACVQGTTTADDFSNITTEYGNGPGQKLAGIDFRVDYDMAAFSGDLSLGLAITKNQTNEASATILDGVELTPAKDRLGLLNFATIGFAAPEYRANINVNYAWDVHNVRLVMNYISGVKDERFILPDGSIDHTKLTNTTPGRVPGTTNAFPTSYYGVNGQVWISTDVHYVADYSFGTISASIGNLLDRDPPEAREELGYDPRMGSPLGRTFKIAYRKEF